MNAFSLQTTKAGDHHTRIQLDWTLSDVTIKWLRNIAAALIVISLVSLGVANQSSIFELLVALLASKP